MSRAFCRFPIMATFSRTGAWSLPDRENSCSSTATSRNSTSAKRKSTSAATATSSNIAVFAGGTKPMNKILDIKSVSLSFGGLQVLRNLHLDAFNGEVTALIGPNGAGKTALLNCISGIYQPQSGKILFSGDNLIGQ